MAKTLIDIDDILLHQAQKSLATTTKKETVNEALGEAVRVAALGQFVHAITRDDIAEEPSGFVLVVLCYVVSLNGRLQRWHAPAIAASRACSSRSTA